MPSSPRKPDKPSSTPNQNPSPHEIPCAQEERIKAIEAASLEQRECLIRIEEKLKTDFRCIEKLSRSLDQIIVGNSSPGLPTRLSVLEGKCETMEKAAEKTNQKFWAVVLLALGSLLTAVISHIWPKGS